MNDSLLQETAARLFRDHVSPAILAASERGEFARAAWGALAEAGLHRALLPENAGGFGVPVVEALLLLRIAGAHALPLPLAETMLAGWLLARAGLTVPHGPLTIAADPALSLRRQGAAWRLQGNAVVPWARHADAMAVLAEWDGAAHVALLPREACNIVPGETIAREPRDALTVDTVLPAESAAATDIGLAQFRAAGAATRTLMIAGALTRITAMTVQYAQERVQFGRPIGRFQVIQHNLATLAAQSAAAVAAGDLAAEAFAEGLRLPAIAAAKTRAGEAAGMAAGIAHQVHGAIGFTYEHSLHFFTKRLWAWREEYGDEAEWSLMLGCHLASAGADRLWLKLTAL